MRLPILLPGRRGAARRPSCASAAAGRQRGNVAVLSALMIVALLAMTAMVVDLGHYWQVRAQLQNGADAAALAGVRDLNGTLAQLPVARLTATSYAAQHVANGSAINLAASDVDVGTWDPAMRSYAPATGSTPPYAINAVRVTAKRYDGDGGAVAPWFAQLFGKGGQNLSATSIAVGGGPQSLCGFPVGLPSCAVTDADGVFTCPGALTFNGGQGKDAGFTLLNDQHPTPPAVGAMISAALAGNCPNNTSIADDPYFQNGNDLPKQSVTDINDAVAAAGAKGVFVDVPVVDVPDCSKILLNRQHHILGYMRIQLTGASWAPTKAIYATGACNQASNNTAGGGFFGLGANGVFLGQ